MTNNFEKNKRLIYGVSAFVLFAAFFYINLPFLLPILIAGIFALGLHDFVMAVSKKIKTSHTLTVWGVLLIGFTFFWGPLALAFYRITVYISQNQDNFQSDALVGQLKALKTFSLTQIQAISEFLGTDLSTPAQQLLEKSFNAIGGTVLTFSSALVSQLPALFLATLVFTVFLFAFLLGHQTVWNFTQRYSFFNPRVTQRLTDLSKNACKVTLFSTFVIGLLQATLIGVSSLIFKVGDFWLVLTMTFFVSFIPVIGAAPVGYLLAVLAFIHDRTGAGIGLAIFATVAGSIDNILKPYLIGSDQEVPAIVGFTCVVGAIIMMGLPGLLLGPVIMSLFAGVMPVLLEEMPGSLQDQKKD